MSKSERPNDKLTMTIEKKGKKIFTKEEGCLLAYQIRLLWETHQFLKPSLADKFKALEKKVLDNTEDGGKSYHKTIKEVTNEEV